MPRTKITVAKRAAKWQSKWAGSYGQICAAMKCGTYTGTTEGLSFFHFPQDEDRCAKWAQNIRRADLVGKPATSLRHHRVCALHFETSQFKNANKRNSINWNAVPTLMDVPYPPSMSTRDKPATPESDTPPQKTKRKIDSIATDTNSASGCVMESMAASSLTVKWDAPAGEHTSYIVTLDDGSGSEETKTPDQDVTSAKFTGLTAGKSYTVQLVTASTSGSAKFYTVPIAVTNLALESRTTRSLKVKWTAPAGIWTGYTVILDDVEGNVQIKASSKEATSVEFTGLVAGTQYTVRVFTLSGGPSSVKTEDKFYTLLHSRMSSANSILQEADL